jgi:hypothetical protein
MKHARAVFSWGASGAAHGAVFVVVSVLCSQSLWAQSETELRDRLITIYMITVSPDLCGFGLSENQAAAVGKLSDDLEDQLNISEEDAQKLYDQIENQMSQQKASGLCDPKGSWAQKFRDSVAKLGK